MITVAEQKHPQETYVTEKFFAVKRLYLPLAQHTGKPSKLTATLKSAVNEADILAECDGLISSNLAAPKKGVVSAIEAYKHPVLGKSQTIIMQCEEDAKRYVARKNVDALSPSALIEIVKKAGIVGMGGACFPTHVKLSPPRKVDTLIINGCECEPYLVCDYRLMCEKTEEVFRGIELLCRIIRPKRVVVAIEENKPDAIKKCNQYVSTKRFVLPDPRVSVLKSQYPQGGEKQLIYRLTKRKVPAGGLPFDVGCLVQNVATCFALYEAVYFDKPLIERIVTFAGGALKNPKNVWLKIGTCIQDLFDEGVLELKEDPAKVVYGGPMMGIALDSFDYPILKGTSGVLFLTKSATDVFDETVCIRCGRCVDACPMDLVPLEYVRKVKHAQWQQLNDFNISDCIECGCCSFACPARIPIVHYIKLGKKNASGY